MHRTLTFPGYTEVKDLHFHHHIPEISAALVTKTSPHDMYDAVKQPESRQEASNVLYNHSNSVSKTLTQRITVMPHLSPNIMACNGNKVLEHDSAVEFVGKPALALT